MWRTLHSSSSNLTLSNSRSRARQHSRACLHLAHRAETSTSRPQLQGSDISLSHLQGRGGAGRLTASAASAKYDPAMRNSHQICSPCLDRRSLQNAHIAAAFVCRSCRQPLHEIFTMQAIQDQRCDSVLLRLGLTGLCPHEQGQTENKNQCPEYQQTYMQMVPLHAVLA